jgi:DNA-binding NtrC family response regulator
VSAPVFIVAADELLLRAFARVLEKAGHRVLGFLSPTRGLGRAGGRTSLRHPLRAVHSGDDGHGVPPRGPVPVPACRSVLILSGDAPPGGQEAVTDGVVDACVAKPWHSEALLQAVARAGSWQNRGGGPAARG